MNALRNCAVACLLLFVPQLAGAQRNRLDRHLGGQPAPSGPRSKPIRCSTSKTRPCESACAYLSEEPRSAFAFLTNTAPHPSSSARRLLQCRTIPRASSQARFRLSLSAGRNSVTIPAGAPVLSDPVAFPVTSGAEISISLYFPKRVATPTVHALALKRAVVSQHGDHTRAEKIEAGATSESSILVSAVLVPAQPSQRLVVAFGDSVTDGDGSTVDADRNWPSDLIRRLGKTPEGSKLAVVNAGIAGNRLLSDWLPAPASVCFGVSALARFDRDALALPGVTHIVLLEGINDIGFPGAKLGGRYLADPADIRAPEDLIDAYRQLISRAHAHGVKLIGATISSF